MKGVRILKCTCETWSSVCVIRTRGVGKVMEGVARAIAERRRGSWESQIYYNRKLKGVGKVKTIYFFRHFNTDVDKSCGFI